MSMFAKRLLAAKTLLANAEQDLAVLVITNLYGDSYRKAKKGGADSLTWSGYAFVTASKISSLTLLLSPGSKISLTLRSLDDTEVIEAEGSTWEQVRRELRRNMKGVADRNLKSAANALLKARTDIKSGEAVGGTGDWKDIGVGQFSGHDYIDFNLKNGLPAILCHPREVTGGGIKGAVSATVRYLTKGTVAPNYTFKAPLDLDDPGLQSVVLQHQGAARGGRRTTKDFRVNMIYAPTQVLVYVTRTS